MTHYKYVHIIHNDKFIVPFMEFVAKHFDANEHLYIFAFDDNMVKFPIPEGRNVKDITNRYPGKKNLLKFSAAVTPHIIRAKKVILHGLFSSDLVNYFYTHRWFLKKCYWVMWGGDFYFPEKQSYRKRHVIKKMGFVVNGLRQDYELAREWYALEGEYVKCFSYTTNLHTETEFKEKKHTHINILVGNSADKTNEHLSVFEQLLKFRDEDIRVYVPLSYGNAQYADDVIRAGKELFGEKFIPLQKYLPFNEYMDLLSMIDIAVFNHQRQQAFGNIVLLMSLGVKIFMNRDSALQSLFKEYALTVYDNKNISLELLDNATKELNKFNLKKAFSEEALAQCLSKIFGYRSHEDVPQPKSTEI